MENLPPKKHYVIYKTTNLINGKFYIGAHSTNDLNDSYLGSGDHLLNSVRKYGRKNFKREILEELPSEEEMYQREQEIVNEDFIKRKDTYNIKVGGRGGVKGAKLGIRVRDADGNEFSVKLDDKRFLSKELVPAGTGYSVCRDKNDKIYRVKSDDPRIESGELVHITKGRIFCIDKNNKFHRVYPDDPRLDSGEFIKRGFSTGRKHSEEAKIKISEKNKVSLKGDRNFMYNKHWIYNSHTKERKAVSLEEIEEYRKLGWEEGSFQKNRDKRIIHNIETKEELFVPKEEIEEYRKLGWKIGTLNALKNKRRDLTEEEKKINRLKGIEKQKETIAGRVRVTNGLLEKFISKEEAEELISTGNWKLGRKYAKRRPTMWIYKEDKSKRILVEKLEDYLLDGWLPKRKSK